MTGYPIECRAHETLFGVTNPALATLIWSRLRPCWPNIAAAAYAVDLDVTGPGRVTLSVWAKAHPLWGGIGGRLLVLRVPSLTEPETDLLDDLVANTEPGRAISGRKEDAHPC